MVTPRAQILMHGTSARRTQVPATRLVCQNFFYYFSWLLVVLLPTAPILASPRVIDGISFPVEGVISLDPSTSKVTLLGSSRIVSSADVETTIVEQSFKSSQFVGQLKVGELRGFISSALKEDRTAWASAALSVLLKRAQAEDAGLEELLAEFAAIKGSSRAFESVLLNEHLSPKVASALLLEIAGQDPAWLRAQGAALTLLRLDDVRVLAEKEIWASWRSRNIARADEVLRRLKLLSGQGDKGQEGTGEEDSVYRHLSSIQADLNKIAKSESGEIAAEKFQALFDLESSEPALYEVLHPLVLDLFHQEVQREISRGKMLAALVLLTRLRVDRRTPTTLELLQNALRGILSADVPQYFPGSVEAMLDIYAGYSAPSKALYVSVLEHQVRDAIQRRNLLPIEVIFAHLRKVRPDPDPSNDVLRFERALAYLDMDQSDNARMEVSHIQTGLTLGQRVQLFGAGYYLHTYWIGVIVLAFFLSLIIIVLRRKIRFSAGYRAAPIKTAREFAAERPSDDDDDDEPLIRSGSFSNKRENVGRITRGTMFEASEEEAEEGKPRMFVNAGSVGALNPKLSEYHFFLRKFGLGATATVSEIKGAYRQAVKSFHPDAHTVEQREAEGFASEKFIETTNLYERILALRKELKMHD